MTSPRSFKTTHHPDKLSRVRLLVTMPPTTGTAIAIAARSKQNRQYNHRDTLETVLRW